MVYEITSIYDSVSRKYSAPTIAINAPVAVREFLYACKTVKGMPVDDLKLVKLGMFDDETGAFEIIPEVLLVRGSDLEKEERYNE